MKKFFWTVFIIIIGTALTFGMAYSIDRERMDKGKDVVFSTWGKKYAPKIKNKKSEAVSNNARVDVNKKTFSSAETLINTTSEVTLYFPDTDLMHLRSEKRILETEEGIEKAVVEAIIEGPQSELSLSALTPDVKVLSASVNDGSTTCVVDLSKEFVLNNTGGSLTETFAIYSVVNSLCQLPGIENVKINIEGNTAAVFGGHFDISTPIEPDMTIVLG